MDVPVKAEQVGYDTIAGVYGYGDAVGSFLDGDLIGGFAELGGSLQHFSQAAVDLPRMTRVVGNPLWSTTWPGVSSPNPGQTVAVFLGGREGYGHDPSNYTDYLVGHHNVSIAGFEASVAAAGYAAPGDVYTIDVSIPSDPAGAVAP